MPPIRVGRRPSTSFSRPGNEADFQAIEDNILELSQRFRVVSVGYDPWQSTQLAKRLRA